MTRAVRAVLLSTVLLAGAPAAAQAQQSLPGIDNIVAEHSEQVGTSVESHYRFSGDVEMSLGDAMLYADVVEVFVDKDLMVATGNVTLVQTTNRIAAERGEFNYKT